MIIPVPAVQTDLTPDPHQELRVALRLLSGKDCERDAGAAHVRLLQLSEGARKTVAADAAEVLKRGVTRGWFRDTVPKHSELERIAGKSLTGGTGTEARLMYLLIAGILTLVVGVGAFMAVETGETESIPIVAVMTVILALGMVLFVKKMRLRG